MNVGEAVRTGCVEIRSNKLRSFLSFAAVSFGVAAILYTFAQVNRMYERREKAMDLAGQGRLEISAKWSRGEDETPGLSKGLTTSDAEAIRQEIPGLYMVSPTLHVNSQFRYGDFFGNLPVTGITPEWRKRDWVYSVRGRLLDDEDLASAAKVCLLEESGGWAGEKPYWARRWKEDETEAFIQRHELLGRTVQLNDGLFTVVGILRGPPRDKDPRWFRAGGSRNAYVPLSAAQRYLSSAMRGGAAVPDVVDSVVVDTADMETVANVKRLIEDLLRVRHRGANDFEVRDFREMVLNMLTEMRRNAVAILSVGIVAILAGGVGIMNVTLATIFSRIREIGVRRAVGATKIDILFQFVTEAMLLGLLGGVAGIGLGLVLLKYVGKEGAEQIQALLWWHLAATLLIASGTGFLFSLYPAYQASKLDPVEALRYE